MQRTPEQIRDWIADRRDHEKRNAPPSGNTRDRLHGTDALVVELTVPIEVQRDRLETRGDTEQEITKRLADRLSEGYGDETPRDLTIDTDGMAASDVADQITVLASDRGGGGASRKASRKDRRGGSLRRKRRSIRGRVGMRSKFTSEARGAILDLLADGLTLKDVCREVEIREKTVKGWLTKGRKEDDGDYAEFAAAVDASRQDAADFEQPMDEAELKLAVSKAAKKGSVAAQKLLWEMLRAATDDPDEDEDADPFTALDAGDELQKRREAKAI